jgi:protein required for attachment to host cells
MTKISHDDLILVADGRKALFLRNHGDAALLDLRVEKVLSNGDNGKTFEQGADRPGRINDSMSGRPSAYEQTDWHDLSEQEFARTVGATLNEHDRSGKIASLIVVAPPAALADLRKTYSVSLKAKLKREIAKDLTKHDVKDIERILAG